jgi:hypothetical protein
VPEKAVDRRIRRARPSVFVSYRRDVSWATASLVFKDLTEHGYDVFLDVHGLASGDFEHRILAEIAARTHFVVILEPGSLDRTADPDDWVRREIAHALSTDRVVVPILAGGFTFRSAPGLPPDIAAIAARNAVPLTPVYFAEGMQRLRSRFLEHGPGHHPRRIRPLALDLLLWLVLLGSAPVVFVGTTAIFGTPSPGSRSTPLTGIWFCAAAAVPALLAVLTRRGRAWARIPLAVYVCGICLLVLGLGVASTAGYLLFCLAVFAPWSAAAGLAFLPAVNRYFRHQPR